MVLEIARTAVPGGQTQGATAPYMAPAIQQSKLYCSFILLYRHVLATANQQSKLYCSFILLYRHVSATADQQIRLYCSFILLSVLVLSLAIPGTCVGHSQSTE